MTRAPGSFLLYTTSDYNRYNMILFLLPQISELYSMVKKWETTADVLPKVVDRLSALKDLHEQGIHLAAIM